MNLQSFYFQESLWNHLSLRRKVVLPTSLQRFPCSWFYITRRYASVKRCRYFTLWERHIFPFLERTHTLPRKGGTCRVGTSELTQFGLTSPTSGVCRCTLISFVRTCQRRRTATQRTLWPVPLWQKAAKSYPEEGACKWWGIRRYLGRAALLQNIAADHRGDRCATGQGYSAEHSPPVAQLCQRQDKQSKTG